MIFLLFPVAFLFLVSCKNDTIDGNNLNFAEFQKAFVAEFQNALIADCTAVPLDTRGLSRNQRDSIQRAESDHIPSSWEDLEGLRMVQKIYLGSKDAGIKVPGFGGITLGSTESNSNLYFIATRIYHDSIVYGCGYSIHYLFKKVKKGISIDNIANVAASAQLNNSKTQVYYSMQTYGMISKDLIKYFKPVIDKNFDVEGFGIMKASINGIQNVLEDSVLHRKVKFTPMILKFVKANELDQ